MEIVQIEGERQVTREVEVYNLDAAIAVGYRVNSIKATHFRIWKDRKAIFHPGGIERFQTMYLRLEKGNGIPDISIFLVATKEGHEADKWARDIANMY